MDQLMQHEAGEGGEGGEIESCHGLWQSLIVTRQAAAAGRPGKATLRDPAAGQQDKTLPGLGQLHHHWYVSCGGHI